MTNSIYQSRILILDFGSQYTQLIARRIREIGVYCEIWHWQVSEDQIRNFHPNGVILSGGPSSTTERNSPKAPAFLFNDDIPILGICYGMQTLCMQLDGLVETSTTREFGKATVELIEDSVLFSQLDKESTELTHHSAHLEVWMSHGDKVVALPNDFKIIGHTDNCPIAIIEHQTKPIYGIQFHPEVTHTKQGGIILERFIKEICHCKLNWKPSAIIESIVADLKAKIGQDEVILALSGGVDSSVTALLLQKAIGKQLTCIFVDNGLLRLNEAKQVMAMFKDLFELNVIQIKAEDRFLTALAKVQDPEEKRKIIGRVFIEIFDEEAAKHQVKWLAQGTIYPDIIESAATKTGNAHVIKSHHNVGGLPENMTLKLIEPLKELFKDEVRKIGLELGLPYDMLYRHPFPGPGLGVRVLGEVKKEYCDLLRQADAIFVECLKEQDLYYKVSQAFAVFLPVRSVGVMGDGRKYDWTVALRAVETVDFMTAHWAHLPYEFLGLVSNRIINEVAGISRVVYDISGKPPATIEWE